MTSVINPSPDLDHFLKSLKLMGMLDNLHLRNQEAISNKSTYLDFLAMILQDEMLRRSKDKFKLRIKRSGFKMDKTLENFDFSFNPKINQAQIKDLCSCRFIEEKTCILIVGPCGTGKSHLAQAIGCCAVQKGFDVLFTTQSKLLSELQKSKGVGSYDQKIKSLIKLPLLIIDDFGLKPLKAPHDEELHELISERYETASTIITSNLDLSEWRDAFHNRLLGTATIDRMRHGAYSVILEGKSYRRLRQAR